MSPTEKVDFQRHSYDFMVRWYLNIFCGDVAECALLVLSPRLHYMLPLYTTEDHGSSRLMQMRFRPPIHITGLQIHHGLLPANRMDIPSYLLFTEILLVT